MFIAFSIFCFVSVFILIWISSSNNDPRAFCLIFPILAIGAFLLKLSDNPTAMDVYQNKTTLKYTIIDGVKTDSVVVWKKEFNN
jgi:hypothetical protein